MPKISRSGRAVFSVRQLPLVAVGAMVWMTGVACSNPTIVGDGKGGRGGTGQPVGGNAGNNGGAGGSYFTLPPMPDAGPDRPGGGNCGDKIIQRSEGCDDGNTDSGDGCSRSCQIEANWICPKEGEPCENMAICGNKLLTTDETCDDGNTEDGDGCSKDCKAIEDGYVCPVPGKKCIPNCGDSKKTGVETCDDGNGGSGDGCSSTCQLEPGYACDELGKACVKSVCGNGKPEKGEQCDCGTDPKALPEACKAVNGLFYGDGKGCSKTCTKEPNCQDDKGKTQACTSACGDGNQDTGESCDDGDREDGDGCSSNCELEDGFTCTTETIQDSTTCQSGSGECLALPIVYRDFQPENVTSGGHPDFFFLGTRYNGSKSSTTLCVPNSGGPSKGNDSTKRCWGILGNTLLKGKPQAGSTTTCECQFSDWNIANSSRIPGNYTEAGNDSPMSNGNGGFLGGTAGTTVNATGTTGQYTGTLTGYTASSPGGPIWKGSTPAFKNADSLKQWYTDDSKVNSTYTDVLEMKSIGSNIYQYASTSHLAEGGFYPLDTLNAAQATLCNLWPYWNHGSGTAIFATCSGDQYLFPPRVLQTDCPDQNPLSNGCWVTGIKGIKHNNYFTDEARYYFVYDGAVGMQLSFFGDDDLFIFINGNLVLDLGGVHQQLPGKVIVSDATKGDADVTEGGCLDTAGNIIGVTTGSTDCSPTNGKPPTASSPDDFRKRTVPLGLVTGKTYEIAIFGADRHPPESNYQLTLNGFATKKSMCKPRCGDGVATNGEQCDCGDGSVPTPDGCSGPNNDTTYGGCKTDCTFGPFCGDGKPQKDPDGPEECDLGKENGDSSKGRDGCTIGCKKPHFCGDEIVDTDRQEECDLGDKNGLRLDKENVPSDAEDAKVYCTPECAIPPGIVF